MFRDRKQFPRMISGPCLYALANKGHGTESEMKDMRHDMISWRDGQRTQRRLATIFASSSTFATCMYVSKSFQVLLMLHSKRELSNDALGVSAVRRSCSGRLASP
jgi:hypothetical protein